jgi:hypothetical protein
MQYELIIATDPEQQRVSLRLLDADGMQRGAQQVQLAEQLLSSLDSLSETEIEQLWFQEAARRAAELDQGLVRREAQALLK